VPVNPRNRLCGAIGVIFACWACVANSTACGPGVVTGLFRGVGKPTGGTTIEVMLNLVCADNACIGQLFTSMGDFAVKDTRMQDAHVDVDFDSGASLGTLHLTSKGKALDGFVELGGDRGTVALKKVGPPLDLDAMKPNLNLTPAQWHADLHFSQLSCPRD
jgi:hypothetical protein